MALVTTALQQVGIGPLIGDAVNVYMAGSDYKHARQEGNSKAMSVAKAAGSFAWGEFFYGGAGAVASGISSGLGLGAVGSTILGFGLPLAATAVMSSAQIASAVWQNNANQMSKAYNSNGKLGSGHFNMTQAGYTMRQRSLNAIRSNGLNIQSALGNEARQYIR